MDVAIYGETKDQMGKRSRRYGQGMISNVRRWSGLKTSNTYRVDNLSPCGLALIRDDDPVEAVFAGIRPSKRLLTQSDDKVAGLVDLSTCSET